MLNANAKLLSRALLFFFALNSTSISFAQTTTSGALRGRIYEAGSNLPISNATVIVTNEETQLRRTAITDSAGDFLVPILPPGFYTVTFQQIGYENQTVASHAVRITSINIIPPVYLRLKIKTTNLPDYLTRPEIHISSPQIIPGQEIKLSTSRVKIAGQAVSKSRISFLIVQGRVVATDDHGNFSVEAVLKDGINQFTVVAIDIYRNWTTIEFTLIKETDIRGLYTKVQDESARLKLQKYYALVIGNDSYQFIKPLKTAVNDAQEIATILRDRYGFATQMLLNAGREKIVVALNEYRKRLDENSNLLIYYAGHGYYDLEVEKAYWLPVDARSDENVNWISADDVTTNIRPIPARHILIISDSCYSGAIARGANLLADSDQERERYIQRMLEGKSRKLMSSGGNEPVADGGAGNHSVFANALIRGLTGMSKSMFTAGELFYGFIEEPVAGKSQQTPQYSPLRNSGHESGDFIFVRKYN